MRFRASRDGWQPPSPPASVDQQARDVVTFLTWAAEPTMEERKRTGFNVIIFLIGFATLLFFSYRRVWHGKH